MNLIRHGLKRLARGSREGRPGLAALGSALVAAGLLRRFRRSKRELLYAKTLKPGQGLRIRVRGAEDRREESAEL
ncbi:MAG: hypothetical protein ACE5KX_08010 [Acidimicrobiia bacterium]